MAVTPKAAQNVLGEVVALVAKLPPEGVRLVLELIRAIRTSKDPVRALRAATAKALLDASLKKALGRSR